MTLNFTGKNTGEQMKTDELYLGYYLHLIQDIFYRRYVYSEHHFNSSIQRMLKDCIRIMKIQIGL